MSEWKKVTFEEIFLIPLRNGLTKPSKIRGEGIPMVNMKEIFAYDVINDETPMECVPTTVKELENTSLEHNDLIFARQSLTEEGAGKISIIESRKSMVFESHLIRCRLNQDIASPKFYYYFFKSPIGKGTISTIVQQTAAAGIRGSDLKSLEVVYPPLPEQKAIADVLSSLDDKIDLLQRQNETLEKMAETLFRQWFIEEAKEDWEEGDISQLIDFQNGYAFKSKDFTDIGQYHVIKIKNISGNIVDLNQSEYIQTDVAQKVSDNFLIKNGDVLVAMTGAEIGKLGVVPKNSKKLFLNQRVGNLKAKFTGGNYLAYLHLKSDFGQDYIINSATGSAQPNISSTQITSCIFPKIEINELISKAQQVNVYFEKLVENLGQIQTLQNLRDTLLPKLMSGEVRVKLD